MGHADLLRSDGLHEGRLARQGVFCIPFDRRQRVRVVRLIAVQLVKEITDERVVLEEESELARIGRQVLSIEKLTFSPSAQPPHQLTFFRDQRRPARPRIKRYCAPLRRKQWVENDPEIPAPVVASLIHCCTVSDEIARHGCTMPLAPIAGKMGSSGASGRW